jgi:hypothetical protein
MTFSHTVTSCFILDVTWMFRLSTGTDGSLLDRRSSTTLLVSPGAEGLNLPGVNEPPDKILEQPEEHLAMHARQRASPAAGGKNPHQKAEAG